MNSLVQWVVYQLKRINARYLISGDGEMIYQLDGFKLMLPSPRHGLISRSIYTKGVWEEEVSRFLQSIIQPGMTVVDVGAHRGYYAMLCAVKAQRVICFEVNQEALAGLEANIALNGFSHVTAIGKAVFGRSGWFVFDRDHLAPAASGDTDAVVACVTLDDAYAAGELGEAVDLIKIDVEGAELDVLQGGRRLISNQHPRLIVEVHPRGLQGFGHCLEDLLAELASLGYTYTPIDHDEVDLHAKENVTLFCSASPAAQ